MKHTIQKRKIPKMKLNEGDAEMAEQCSVEPETETVSESQEEEVEQPKKKCPHILQIWIFSSQDGKTLFSQIKGNEIHCRKLCELEDFWI